MSPVLRVSRWVFGFKEVRIALKLFALSIFLIVLGLIGKVTLWDNRDVIGYAILNPENVRRMSSDLNSVHSDADNKYFKNNSFPQGVK